MNKDFNKAIELYKEKKYEDAYDLFIESMAFYSASKCKRGLKNLKESTYILEFCLYSSIKNKYRFIRLPNGKMASIIVVYIDLLSNYIKMNEEKKALSIILKILEICNDESFNIKQEIGYEKYYKFLSILNKDKNKMITNLKLENNEQTINSLIHKYDSELKSINEYYIKFYINKKKLYGKNNDIKILPKASYIINSDEDKILEQMIIKTVHVLEYKKIRIYKL